jgi:hypothetical protein
LREVELPYLNGRGHDPSTEAGGPPLAGVGDLGDETMGMKALEDARDLGALPPFILAGGTQVRGGREASADVAVLEAPQKVLSTHEGLKELEVLPGERIEGLGRPARSDLLGYCA